MKVTFIENENFITDCKWQGIGERYIVYDFTEGRNTFSVVRYTVAFSVSESFY